MATTKYPTSTDSLIRFIVEHTHTHAGKAYFKLLVKHLAEGLHVKGAWVTEFLEKEQKLRSLAFWLTDGYVEHYTYDLVHTPCEKVISTKDCLLVPERVIELFPNDPDLAPLNAVSYMGYPLIGKDGEVLGHLAILHDAPLHPKKEDEAVFKLFMQKANAELLRLRALEELKEKKARLASLIDSMSEAILEIDAFGFITMANPAASLLFGFSQKDFEGILVFSLPLENGLGQVGSSRLK